MMSTATNCDSYRRRTFNHLRVKRTASAFTSSLKFCTDTRASFNTAPCEVESTKGSTGNPLVITISATNLSRSLDFFHCRRIFLKECGAQQFLFDHFFDAFLDNRCTIRLIDHHRFQLSSIANPSGFRLFPLPCGTSIRTSFRKQG